MDGIVVIGTKLDTKQLEKDIKEAEKSLKSYEKDAEKLTKEKASLELKLEGYEKTRAELEETQAKMRQLKQETETMDVSSFAQLEKYKQMSAELGELDNKASSLIQKVQEEDSEYSSISRKLDDINKKYEANIVAQGNLTNKISEMKSKLGQSKIIDLLKDLIKEEGSSITKIVKQVTKWGLAIFGVRSAYMAIRSSMSILSQYNTDLANKIENIRYALATSLESIVTWLVDLVYKLLQYANYLTKAWFGFSVFSNKAAKSTSQTSKNLKEMKKTLAAFDEMNVLNDNGTSGVDTGGYVPQGIKDLSDMEVPKWMEGVKKFGKWVIENWEDVVSTLLLIKFVIDIMTGNWVGAIIDFILFIIVNIPRLVDALKGIWDVVVDVFDWIVDKLVDFGGWVYDEVISPFVQNWKDGFSDIKDWAGRQLDKISKKYDDFKDNWETGMYIIKDKFGKTFGSIGSFITEFINNWLDGFNIIKNAFNNLFGGIKDFLSGKINILGDIKMPSIKFPKLAQGGIISQPGRGVMLGSAIGGEKGSEGVIPLTDSQQMALLGEAIGRYITINANITNTMNGRVISRELQKVQNQSDFAVNR